MDESVRKPLTFLAVVFIGASVALGYDRVKASQTFMPDFGAGKDLGHVNGTWSSEALVYKVQPGDAWWKIARDHSISTHALLDANGATLGTGLVPGQSIRLPGGTPGPSSPSASPTGRSR